MWVGVGVGVGDAYPYERTSRRIVYISVYAIERARGRVLCTSIDSMSMNTLHLHAYASEQESICRFM